MGERPEVISEVRLRPEAVPGRSFLGRTFQALRYRDFRLLWLGAATSTTGTWMQQVAESWVVLSLTNSAFYLGLTAFLGQLPIILFTLIGGVVADRVDRRKLLLGSQYAQMTTALILTALIASGRIRIWHFLVIVFLVGTAQATVGPAVWFGLNGISFMAVIASLWMIRASFFRDLFTEILSRHPSLADPAAIFPGFAPDPARFPGMLT